MTQERREEIMMEKAINTLQSFQNKQVDTFINLKEKVAEIVRKGVKTAFNWRHLRIDYKLRDEVGIYRTHFIVSNPYTGNQKRIYVRDFIGKTGAIKYQELAHSIKMV